MVSIHNTSWWARWQTWAEQFVSLVFIGLWWPGEWAKVFLPSVYWMHELFENPFLDKKCILDTKIWYSIYIYTFYFVGSHSSHLHWQFFLYVDEIRYRIVTPRFLWESQVGWVGSLQKCMGWVNLCGMTYLNLSMAPLPGGEQLKKSLRPSTKITNVAVSFEYKLLNVTDKN